MRWIVNLEGGPRRVNHASVAVGDFIYSFGGYCNGEDYRSTSAIDVHILNTNNLRWQLAPTVRDEHGVPSKYPDVPFQRYGHTATAHRNKVYLWGGRNDEIVCNILYCYDTKTMRWSKPAVTGSLPGARDGHSSCVYGDRMYIFGGFEEDADKFSRDVHYLDFNTMNWTHVHTQGIPPSYRDFHSATIVNDKMFVFGGRGDVYGPYHSHEEIYCSKVVYLDLKTDRWEMPKTTGEEPLGRRSHSAFVYNDQIYIFGGYNGIMDMHFNDFYCFDPVRFVWQRLRPQGHAPRARRRQSCLVVDKRMYLFGGTCPSHLLNSVSYDYSDTHVLDFDPTLRTLSMLSVIKHKQDTTCLPRMIRMEIQNMTMPNKITRTMVTTG